MLEDFQKHIQTTLPFLQNAKLLVAVSGGLDSMVLLHLCLKSDFDVAVAHCNFNLRAQESDGDEAFVKAFCQHYDIACYQTSFQTKEYANTKGISTQMAARALRYDWFKELLYNRSFEYLLTAHHLNDDIETFLINFSRGTGLKGLTGIPMVNEKTVRPLLTFSRKQLHDYAIESGITWREDASNASDKYVRNHLRHHAIPALEEASSDLLNGYRQTRSHLEQSEKLLSIYEKYLREQFTFSMQTHSTRIGVAIDLVKLAQYPEPNAVLYRLLSCYGFTAWEDIYALRSAQTGKQVFSKTHRLLKNRDVFEVYAIDKQEHNHYSWPENQQIITGDFGYLSKSSDDECISKDRQTIAVATDLLKFPLTVRKWAKGDYFYPFGMQGKKKLSKYLKDEKLSLITKENVWLLCSGKDIVWVIGYRADDRFKINDKTRSKTIFNISYETTSN